MKQHDYTYNRINVFRKSGMLWFLISIQAGLICCFIFIPLIFPLPTLLIFQIILSALTIPGIVLHFNHLKGTRNTRFILKYETISLEQGNKVITLKSNEICKVILHEGPTNSRFPWYNYNWIEFLDTKGNSIAVSFYLLEIGDFWVNTLSRGVSSKYFERDWNFFPLLKQNTRN